MSNHNEMARNAKMNNTDFREHIYNLVCGNFNLKDFYIPESNIVKNEFEEGSPCSEGYRRMLDAYARVCKRLGSPEWEDEDVEVIINELLDISRLVALKMFDYGLYYRHQGIK